MTDRPLVVICGPTASGKTGLAILVAKEYGGEIISADSRAIYRGLDVGTAKPSLKEQQGIPHWGFDLVDPGERFTAADFKHYALQKIDEIRSRGRLPILVGGTGLYVDSVVYDYSFSDIKIDTELQQTLQQMTVEALIEYCQTHNIKLPENYKNKRHLINAIVRKDANLQRKPQPISNTIVVSISTDKTTLRRRIEMRVDQIFAQGGVEEAASAARKFGWDNEAMTGNIYPIARRMLAGEIDESEAKRQMVVADWQLAKRQTTWLKRNEHVNWQSLDDAYTFICLKLADEHIS